MPLPPSADAPPSRWLRLFAIDLRSLALFRIALGLLILAGLALRTVDFRIFQTDAGVWPVAAAWGEERGAGMWSLHLLNGSFEWQATLWIAEALAGLALVLGWRTRVVAVLAWLLVASAQKRNVMVVGGAGGLLRLLLFWGMWLPLGARWSLDARRRGAAKSASGERVLSVASAALLLQVALVYWMNALHKSDAAWRTTGEAAWVALSVETYSRSAGRALLEWPRLLRILTHATFALESLGPVFAFVPWATARWRLLTVGLFVGFHAGLAATLSIGLFPYVSIASWLPFLPGEWWSRAREIPRFLRTPRPVHAAAAVCLLCVLGWNARLLFPWLFPVLNPICRALRLEQHWAMFAPRPRGIDTWFVPVGTDARGVETDLWTGESPVKWRRPRDFATFFPTGAWKLYLLNLRAGSGPRSQLFVEWLARRWQSTHPGAPLFTKLELYGLQESIYHRGEVPDNYLIYTNSPAENVSPVRPAPEDGIQ